MVDVCCVARFASHFAHSYLTVRRSLNFSVVLRSFNKDYVCFNYSFDLLTRSPLQQMFDDLFRIIDNYCCCVPRHLLGGLVTTQYVRTPFSVEHTRIHKHTPASGVLCAFYAIIFIELLTGCDEKRALSFVRSCCASY